MNALEVTDVSFGYKSLRALDKVSLTVPEGRFVALLGSNGAGKTTLFSIITGLYRAHSGRVSVMGRAMETDTLSALAAMGVVFQKSTLDMDLTVLQNLRYAAELHGMKKSVAQQKIDDAIALHGMKDYSSRKVGSLSGGQKRRVELARALLHSPSLLLLDEPTVGLDLNSRVEFVSHVKSLCQSRRTGVLWATHLMDEVDQIDDVTILDKGEVIAQGVASNLLQQYGATDIGALFHSLTNYSLASEK